MIFLGFAYHFSNKIVIFAPSYEKNHVDISGRSDAQRRSRTGE